MRGLCFCGTLRQIKAPLTRGGGICEHHEQMTERLSMSLCSNLSVTASPRQLPFHKESLRAAKGRPYVAYFSVMKIGR